MVIWFFYIVCYNQLFILSGYHIKSFFSNLGDTILYMLSETVLKVINSIKV